jgi:hypothetical protein
MRDLKSNINATTALVSADYAGSDQDSAEVDLQGYDSVAFILEVGTITATGTVTPALEHSDTSGSGFEAVPANEVVGELADLATDTNQKVSYNGIKRYVRLSTTETGTVTAATYGVLEVRGRPEDAAVAVG